MECGVPQDACVSDLNSAVFNNTSAIKTLFALLASALLHLTHSISHFGLRKRLVRRKGGNIVALVSSIQRFFLIFFSLPVGLLASLPELSSIDPIEYDEAAQRLVARGDARLNLNQTQVEADQITYYQEYSVADAMGRAAIMHEGYRLTGDRISYDAENRTFSVEAPKTGSWPLYASSLTAGGTLENMELDTARVYYTDPGPFTPNIKARSLTYRTVDGQEMLEIEGATLQIGNVPFFYLPKYTYYINEAPFYLDFDAGSNSTLGTYLQTTSLVPVTDALRLGANIDYYTNRGAMVGPAAQYILNNDSNKIRGAISSGFINDEGTAGVDIHNNAISDKRRYAEWRHHQQIGERTTLTASASYRSDSAVMRDFRNNIFNENQIPDSFAEATYAGDNYLISAFTRLNLNDFQLVQERLPEVRFDLLPVPIANLGIYQQGDISYARLKEDYNTIPVVAPNTSYQRYDRLDLNYQITRPILLKNWLTLTPLLGARLTHYSNFESTPQSTSQNNTVDRFAAGFDLEANGHSTFTTQNSVWKINGLRHTIRPVLRYRYFSNSQNTGALRTIERSAYSLNRPLLELNDLRNLDTLGKTHLVRLGVENLFQTRAKEYGSHTLAALNFYQDILIAREAAQNNGNEPDTLHATWVEFALNPAPWLKFDLAARFQTSEISLEELLTRTSLISGDSWQLSLSTDLLQSQLDQYRLHFIYRLSDSYSFLAKTRYNANKGVFDYTNIGLLTHLGSAWELLYGFTFRNDAARESDLEFSIGLQLVEP